MYCISCVFLKVLLPTERPDCAGQQPVMEHHKCLKHQQIGHLVTGFSLSKAKWSFLECSLVLDAHVKLHISWLWKQVTAGDMVAPAAVMHLAFDFKQTMRCFHKQDQAMNTLEIGSKCLTISSCCAWDLDALSQQPCNFSDLSA